MTGGYVHVSERQSAPGLDLGHDERFRRPAVLAGATPLLI